MVAHPSLVWRRNPRGARQFKKEDGILISGRGLRCWASEEVFPLRLPFTPKSRERKVSEAVTSAGTSSGVLC